MKPLSKGTMYICFMELYEYFVTHKFLIHIVGNLLYGKSSLSLPLPFPFQFVELISLAMKALCKC